MRYSQLIALEKQLQKKLLDLFLVLVSDPYERKKVIDQIKGFYPGYDSLYYNVIEESILPVINEMMALSLFSPKKLIVIDEVDSLKKEDLQILINAIKKKPSSLVLVLGGASKKKPLEDAVLEKGAIYDLLQETPWDQKKRLFESLDKRFKQEDKTITPDLLELLLEKVGRDCSSLEQEVDKLICFVGNRKKIEKEDVDLVASDVDTETAWKIAEQMIWDYRWDQNQLIDNTFFYSLLFAIRHQLELGHKLSVLIEKGESDMTSYFPKMWGKTLEKRKGQAKTLGRAFFEKGLLEIFKIELLSKDNLHTFTALLDQFFVKLGYF